MRLFCEIRLSNYEEKNKKHSGNKLVPGMFLFFNELKAGTVIAIAFHMFCPHSCRTHPKAAVIIQRFVDNHRFQGFAVLCDTQESVLTAFEMAVFSNFNLFHNLARHGASVFIQYRGCIKDSFKPVGIISQISSGDKHSAESNVAIVRAVVALTIVAETKVIVETGRL